MKKIQAIYSPPHGHWVGNGFPVHTLFSYDRVGPGSISPFLLLDYAGPAEFTATDASRGVGQHPHRGFETVTLVYRGGLEHRDSSGGGGLISEGDVQWMTAGAGIVHEEFHSPDFTQRGGVLEMVQLWVNLPAADKGAPPRYQTLLNADIPRVSLANEAGQVRVIAGEYDNIHGPASTYTRINVWDVSLLNGHSVTLRVPAGQNTLLVTRNGTVLVNDSEIVGQAQLVTFDREGTELNLQATDDSELLLLSGEAIDEPVAGMGPFVMNTREEIQQAVKDFQHGHFGTLNR